MHCSHFWTLQVVGQKAVALERAPQVLQAAAAVALAQAVTCDSCILSVKCRGQNWSSPFCPEGRLNEMRGQ